MLSRDYTTAHITEGSVTVKQNDENTTNKLKLNIARKTTKYTMSLVI